ncbi:ribonuclease H family protein [Candidatus Gromoviella agglomerans]|uniref:ribonuclease H family protein n=1 Tax=Candidatus Gromoviella agglomerans TaxID=2806609 RepID=UPI001E5D05D0|nr:ribonuclease H [Candidatus Gromoviella agglomerans]UFX98343.1 Ribonuclease HI [Candidatus Gromoviella agglomerans]
MIIYTDGACRFNPGPGAWACVAIFIPPTSWESLKIDIPDISHNKHILNESDVTYEIGGKNKDTTNNKMEMTAVIRALNFYEIMRNHFKYTEEITIITDSMYVKDGIEKWITNWQKNNWITSQKTPVKNYDLWQEILRYKQIYSIKWEWTKGHSGNKYNDLADKIARNLISK